MNPFLIRDWKKLRSDYVPSELEKSFEDAKKFFDSQTHESMTRDTIKNKDFYKIFNLKKAAMVLGFLFGTNKVVAKAIR